MEKSLIVTDNGAETFVSNGKWLYPLFELEDFLKSNSLFAGNLFLTDKIAGKAAAFLIVRLGFKKVHIVLISEGALAVFNRFQVDVTFDTMVAKIQCATEELVKGNEDPDAVWQMLRRRAGRVSGLSLSVESLSVAVDGVLVLDSLNLKVGKGDHIFIKGDNGAGKTTLLKAILGILPISSGRIQIGDWQVGTSEWESNRSLLGYVHQDMVKNNFPISASEVVEIGLSGKRMSSAEIQHRTEIAMRRTGCFHLATRSYHELSGGEKQRVNIARCLCQEAKVLLLDEPTSFLDYKAKDELFVLLNELWANEAPTVVVVSHDDQWISLFSGKVLELSNGKIC